jgi:N-hydroxyarylamine O-acetyltransferase
LNIEAYLRRIAYSGTVRPTVDSLRSLHYAHLLAIPFENLDVHRCVPIRLDEDALFEKIVGRNRGGFCYELNGLFACLLREFGFDVSMLSGRVPRNEDDTGPEFDHMALLVKLEKPWLVDVGFGECFVEPLPLEDDVDTKQRGIHYSMDQHEGRWRLLRSAPGDPRGVPAHKADVRDWRMMYDFTLTPRELAEFEGMSRYHQTSPKSHFTQGRICSKLTENGRITLTGTRLVETEDGKRTERTVTSFEEYARVLREGFGIEPDARDADLLNGSGQQN